MWTSSHEIDNYINVMHPNSVNVCHCSHAGWFSAVLKCGSQAQQAAPSRYVLGLVPQ